MHLLKQNNGHDARMFNILQVIYYEPATPEQIKRLTACKKPFNVLRSIEQQGLITEKRGKFTITELGEQKRKELKYKLGE